MMMMKTMMMNKDSSNLTKPGKAPSKGSKTGKSASEKEPVEELLLDVVMDYALNEYRLDWNNPERDGHPFDLSKPLPM
ncbi:hypothetical protein Tco_1294491 [Tanacetum coccineum]